MNNINNNVNFTARMDLSKVTMNKARWQKIATLFEQRTQKYPNDTFFMEDLPNGISGYNYNKNTGDEICVNIKGLELDKLLNMKDSRVISKFKKILDISAQKQKIYDATAKYTEKLSKAVKNSEGDDVSIRIWDNAVDIASQETKALQQQDRFLKDIDILF